MKKLLAICILFLITSCGSQSPELTWDHAPETLIIQVSSSGGGSAPNAALINDLFDAQVWGDGRIVWTTWAEDYQRQVWQGQLSEAEMTALLQTFVDKGFFGMQARYAPEGNIVDGGTLSLSVHLPSTSTKVSEYINGAPSEFHDLVDLLTSGAGVAGTPYLPQSGHLDAREINQDMVDKTDLPVWDAAALGLDLHDAERIWIEGDALMRAWEVVNKNYIFPIIVQGDSYYELRLRLPELSIMAPQ